MDTARGGFAAVRSPGALPAWTPPHPLDPLAGREKETKAGEARRRTQRRSGQVGTEGRWVCVGVTCHHRCPCPRPI